jgi:hypothetical protein
MPNTAESVSNNAEAPISVLGMFTEMRAAIQARPPPFYATRRVDGNRIRGPEARFPIALAYFALRRRLFHPIERVMGQRHRVKVKRKRRSAYLDRKKAAAKAAPVRREPPKPKAKPKKSAAAATEA